jgi:hypothetical protein
MMMMMKERRNQANKRKKSKKKSKNEWKKERKKKRFNCDSFVMMRRFKNEMRSFIFENLRRMFFVSRLNTTMSSLIFINFSTRFEIWYCECCWKNVSSNDEREKENHCWWLMKKIERTKVVWVHLNSWHATSSLWTTLMLELDDEWFLIKSYLEILYRYFSNIFTC